MPDALVVDQRVGGDAGGDGEGQPHAARRAAAHPAHQQDAGGDRDDAGGLAGRELGAERDQRHRQHEHRGGAAGDRVDEAQVGALVGGGEQREVGELERRRGGDVRPRRRVDVPGQHRDGREDDRGGDQRHRPDRMAVALAGDEPVPEGVQARRGEHQRDGRRGQRGTVGRAAAPA
jgi:hypothetical protein